MDIENQEDLKERKENEKSNQENQEENQEDLEQREEEKRNRRTNKEIGELLLQGLEKQIIEKGINGLTVVGISQESTVEPPVIYNRYGNLEEFLNQYLKKYDYWLSDILALSRNKTPRENFKNILTRLTDNLYDSEIMQQILLWELSDVSPTSRRMAKERETQSGYLFDYFNNGFKHLEDPMFDSSCAVLIAGIYYLVLHKKISTFCNTDYDTPEGRQLLIKTIENFIDKAFPEGNEETRKAEMMEEVAIKLLKNDVDEYIITNATNIPIRTLRALKESLNKRK